MQTLTKDDVFTPAEMNEINNVKSNIEDFFIHLKAPIELINIIRNGILTGGASASLFHGTRPNDWDVYLTDQNDIDASASCAPFHSIFGALPVAVFAV